MLPMRKVAKRWADLSDIERAEIERQHPNWNNDELASARWELIGYRKTLSGGLVEDNDYHHDLKKEGG
jgi:hypothetical protein